MPRRRRTGQPVDIEGLGELESTLPGLARVIVSDTMSALEKLGADIALAATRNAGRPVTGKMLKSITTYVLDDAVIVEAGGPSAPYAVVQHQGLHADTLPAHWFLKLAGDVEGASWAMPRIRNAMRRARTQRRLERAVGRLGNPYIERRGFKRLRGTRGLS